MDVLWIAMTAVIACVGGWPVTAGVLKLAKSRTVRAVDQAESVDQAEVVDQAEDVNGSDDPAADSTTDIALEAAPGVESGTESELASERVQPVQPAITGQSVLVGQPSEAGVLRGGLVIGMLERVGVVVAILCNQPVAIAYVVAIKGLGRYPELKDSPASSERFIIGTLASMLWAAVIGVLAKVLLL